MMGFGNNPTTTTQGALPTNQFPLGSVAEPGRANGDLTTLEGGPGSVDNNGNRTAPVSTYAKDGNDVTQGTSTDANTANTVMGRLTKIRDLLLSVLSFNLVDSAGTNKASVSVGGAVKVDNSAVTQPVSGTFFQATQPVSATSLPLPTGAALEAGHLATIDTSTAKIPAQGQALAAASIPVVLPALQQTALTPPAAITGFALEAGHIATIDTSTAASKTNLDTIVTNTNKIPASPAQEGGNLATLAGIVSSSKAAVKSASGDFADGSIVGIGTTTQTKATDGTVTSWSIIQLLKGIIDKLLSTLAVTQSGTWTVQPGNTANTTAWKVDGSAVTQPVSGTFWQATQPISGTVTANQGGTWTEVPNAATSGGSTPYHLISAASTNATNVKSSAGQLYGFEISNTNAAARYIRLYDSGSAPTVGTTTIKKTIQIPANSTVIRAYPVGLAFASGIGFSTTTAMADSDTAAVGAGDLSIDLDYK